MALIIATGSNLGNSKELLLKAKEQLSSVLEFVAESRIYVSKAQDYEAQPDFYNQVLEFKTPHKLPQDVIRELLEIEKSMGRERQVWRGPRTIDIDILFWDLEKISTPELTVPHPRWQERSFVVKPLAELPYFQTIKNCFTIPTVFPITANPI